MAYKIEDKDIVIDGWENGIANAPYEGLGDMRNIDPVTVKGEVSIAMATEAIHNETLNSVTNKTVTVDTSTNVFTWDGSKTLTVGQPIYFYNSTAGNSVPSGITAGVAYYIRQVLSPTTFTVSASIGGPEVDVIAPSKTLTYISYSRSNSPSGTSLTLAKPSGVNAGNIMFMLLFSNTEYINETPKGWTLIGKTTSTGYFELYYKIVTNTDPTNWTVAWNSSGVIRGVITAYSGIFNTSNPIMTSSNTAYVTSDTTLRASSITTTKNNTPIIFIGACYNGSSNRTFTKPSDINTDTWTEDLQDGYNTFSYTFDTLGMTTAGATGNIDATISEVETEKHAWAIALNPIDDTNTVFSTILMAKPEEIIKAVYSPTNTNLYFSYDTNGRVWLYDTNNTLCNSTYKWIYMNNLPDNTVTGKTGNIISWKDYLFVLSSTGIHVVALAVLATMTNSDNWYYGWQTGLTRYEHKAIIGQDDMVYFCNGSAVGRIQETVGETFNISNAITYIYDEIAAPLPSFDSATCLSELGDLVLIGGSNNWIYPWNRLGSSFNPVIRVADNYVKEIVTVNNTSYVFAGHRGQIYVTNGGNVAPFWKIPDYISKVTNPYINWTDADFNRGQLYFGFTVTTNAGSAITEYGGLWAIDVNSSVPIGPRCSNQLSNGNYTSYVTCLCKNEGLTNENNPSADGYGLFIGWYTGTTFSIDKTISTPYLAKAYVDSDIIPVGLLKEKKTFQNLEYKLAVPLVTGESVALSYRTNLNATYEDVPITSVEDVSGLTDTVNFENVQWIQIRANLTTIASGGTSVRLKQIRIR